MILEDAHWIDPTSLEFFSLTIERITSLPVLLVITARPEFAPPWPGHTHISTLTLNRLGRHEGEALASSIAKGKALPREVLNQIIAHTDGVPLFVEELTKTVLESGLLDDAGDRYVLRGPLPSLAIPSTLHASLLARLDRLAAVKDVAQTAAAIGREFSYALIAAVAGLPEHDLRAALAQLVTAELVFQRGVPPDANYLFKHALVQDAAYASLVRSRRQQLHAQIARALEAQFPDVVASEPEVLAHHFTAAGLTERGVLYWQRAGQQASDRSANLEATRHFNTGIELLETLPDTPARTQQELALHTALGAALIVIKGHASAEVEHAYLKARELCQQAGNTTDLVPVLFGLWRFYITRSQVRTARELGETLLRLADDTNDPALAVIGHYTVGFSLYQLGELAEARRHLEDGIARYTRDQRQVPAFRIAQDLGVGCRSYSAMSIWLLGFPDQALARAQDATGIGARAVASLQCRVCAVLVGLRFSVSAGRAHRARAGRCGRRARDRAGISALGRHGDDHAWVGVGYGRQERGGRAGAGERNRRLAGHGRRWLDPILLRPCLRKPSIFRARQKTASKGSPTHKARWKKLRNAGGKLKSIASEASYCCDILQRRRQRQKPGSDAPWTLPAANRPNRWNCAQLPASRACGATRASVLKRAICSRRSMVGLPRASTRPT